ncbi:MAG: Dibenzothiophene desulfurization enzyme C [Paracidovorax wautersii]|uniref:Dibenzothiophene desulfurization enzyme C n=1 Tax=Paracidovorax wautersii TaxID=1177982 RepID=A0A7V8JRD6_9BURK|nr:MAG: Dibenzothiophene desulfurization enzyme C [Paracidovorax wautersii]
MTTDTSPGPLPDLFPFDAHDPLAARARALRLTLHADAPARDQAGGRPVEAVQALKASGLNAAWIPTAYGGEGASWTSVLRAVREIARTDGSIAHLYGYQHLPQHIVWARAAEPQLRRWFTTAAREQWLWSNSGNVMSKTSTARRAGGRWVLDGFRPFSSGTHVADVIQVGWDVGAQRHTALIPANRDGVVIADDWDGIGQRQTGSGTVRFEGVVVHDDEVIGRPDEPLSPFASLNSLLQQLVLANVFIGSAQGALAEGRDYTVAESRPWIHSGVERHADDPWVQRQYGELHIRTQAALELAEQAAAQLDETYAQGRDLTLQARGELAIGIGAANVVAGEVGLAVAEQVYEVMGARSATRARGYDRFWRNVRTHTLHNPAEYKKRTLGQWLLDGRYPEPAPYR